VAPGRIASAAFERGLGAALLVAVLGAALWAVVCRFGKTGAPWALAVAGLAVGAAARAAARARGGRVQLAAGIALFVFFALGEFLVYRHALLPRLEAMHEAEGSADAALLAQRELEDIRQDPERYAAIEATRDFFLAMAAGVAAALWLTRARPAVAAFSAPSSTSPPASSPETLEPQPPAGPSTDASPASDAPMPDAVPPTDGS
jgi:hypothetical protein